MLLEQVPVLVLGFLFLPFPLIHCLLRLLAYCIVVGGINIVGSARCRYVGLPQLLINI
jgi:hypothetical protein